jgi:predicted glycogen debranching enzyme
MAHGSNTTYVGYHLLRGPGAMTLDVQPLCSYRDYHWQHRGARDSEARLVGNGIEVIAYPGAHPYRILVEGGECSMAPDWHWNIRHREEAARGLDDVEDLFRPGTVRMRLVPGESAAVILTSEAAEPAPAAAAWQSEQGRQAALLRDARRGTAVLANAAPAWIEQLVLAADQFVVERGNGALQGKTVIAGYPWFSDWGRDTMIALPGLALATGRPEIAASVLRTFARFASEGMLPNRFPDAGDAPEYNTVDATLWYVVAIDEYLRHRADPTLRRELYPVLKDIIDWHRRGTRFGIHVDPADGLLHSGEPGVQLTWMDAKVGDWVVTPRIGKCVEINALWFRALEIMGNLAEAEGDAGGSASYRELGARVGRSFKERFWNEQGQYLYDVIDGPEGEADELGRRRDASLRPNQILAVSLTTHLLDSSRARLVVERCARELWTPMGLRSLAPGDPRYVPLYEGGPRERDGAYHQGTVWSWLLGPFVQAHLNAYGDTAAARGYLAGMADHLREACIGQVSEIFDGEAPFRSRGCIAQAWGVAELLRAWRLLNEREA